MKFARLGSVVVFISLAGALHAEVLTVDLSGIETHEFTNSSQAQQTVHLPAGSVVTGLGYAVTVILQDAIPQSNIDVGPEARRSPACRSG